MTRTHLRGLLLAAAATCALAAPSADAATNLIANGGFKNGSTPAPGGFVTVGAGHADPFTIPDWEVIDGNVDWITGYWPGSDGDGYSVDLNGFNSHATIGQTIITQIGKLYTLTFDMAANPDYSGTRVAIVGANGNTIGTETFTQTSGPVVWSSRSLNFVANSTSTLITFQSGDPPENCCFGAAIDNVSIAVPEPTSWALMILGFMGTGAMLRRQRPAALRA